MVPGLLNNLFCPHISEHNDPTKQYFIRRFMPRALHVDISVIVQTTLIPNQYFSSFNALFFQHDLRGSIPPSLSGGRSLSVEQYHLELFMWCHHSFVVVIAVARGPPSPRAQGPRRGSTSRRSRSRWCPQPTSPAGGSPWTSTVVPPSHGVPILPPLEIASPPTHSSDFGP